MGNKEREILYDTSKPIKNDERRTSVHIGGDDKDEANDQLTSQVGK